MQMLPLHYSPARLCRLLSFTNLFYSTAAEMLAALTAEARETWPPKLLAQMFVDARLQSAYEQTPQTAERLLNTHRLLQSCSTYFACSNQTRWCKNVMVRCKSKNVPVTSFNSHSIVGDNVRNTASPKDLLRL